MHIFCGRGIAFIMAFLDETMQKLGMSSGAACRVCVYPEAGAVAEGCRGLYYYSPVCVKLRTRGGMVVIEGSALTVGDSCEEEIILRGKVSCVRWE